MNSLRNVFVLVALLFAAALPVTAVEPAACLSNNPGLWPAASKPYFLVIADTSESMSSVVASASSCNYGNLRHAHARCALKGAFEAFDGVAHFGLATYPVMQASCSGACFTGCVYNTYSSENTTRGSAGGCGPLLGSGATTASGASIRVRISPDDFWQTGAQSPPNASQLSGWVDNVCSTSTELFGIGKTPLNGALRDAHRYFTGTYVHQDGTPIGSPLSAFDYPGVGVNGGTGCRSVNVILLTDGDETCDTTVDAVNAATALYSNGVTIGGRTYKVRVHVINFVAATVASANQIAAAGGTGAAIFAADEGGLATALRTIVTSTLRAEVGDNADNNCSSCTDEGLRHYSNTNVGCCAWGNAAARATCLNNFAVSITPANPLGTRTLLPCTTVAQALEPTTWLLHNPGDNCDGTDNNGDGQIDEGQVKCGDPLACPVTEVLNGRDDDCDGAVDEGFPVPVTLSAEICDSCDNDGNGQTDNDIAPIACGASGPNAAPNCAGTLTCKPSQVVSPGACAVGGGYNQCSNTPLPETCDSLDNDCNGHTDDGIAAAACVPAGVPGGLVYGGTSQCRMGSSICANGATVCPGFVGPTADVCDGIDNDCNGSVDEDAVGMGDTCGAIPGLVFDQPPSQCRTGQLACLSAVTACPNVVGPSSEIVGDGVDNNCNGVTDENDIFRNGFETP